MEAGHQGNGAAAARAMGAEARLAGWFFENAPDLFAVISSQGRFLAANPAWSAATGWGAADLIGRGVRRFVHADSLDELAETLRRLRRDGHARCVLKAATEAGGWVWLRGHCRLGPDGEVIGLFHDVTEASRAEAELEQARRMSSLLSEAAGVGSWSYDPREGRIDWSPEWRVMLDEAGVRLESLEDLRAVSHPDDLPEMMRVLGRALFNGRPGRFEHRLRRADGGWLRLRAHIHADALGGGDHRIHGISQDITEIAEARDAALRGEQQTRQMVQEAPFAVAMVDRDLRFMVVSPRWIEIFGLTAEDYLGRRPEDLLPSAPQHIRQAYRRALDGEVVSRSEDRLLDAAGRRHWIRWEVRPWRDASGAIAGVLAYIDDISAMARARQDARAYARRLKVALGAADAGVFELDYEHQTFWASPEFLRLTGRRLTYADATLPAWPIVHPDDAEAVAQRTARWRAGEPIEPFDFRLLRPDGQVRWTRFYYELKKDASGRWRKAAGLLMDFDDHKRQELALIAAKRAAQEAAEAKSRFVANMSHEIRTPMNGVLGVLHLLKGEDLSADGRVMLEEALACGRMLQELLNDVIDFSKVEAGRLELVEEPFSPAAVAEGVASLLRPQAQAKGLSLTVDVSAAPAWVRGDPVRLRQALFNLIGNAVKFTLEGWIAVRARPVEGPLGPRLVFEVEDTGVGIPEAARGRLFERFHQADASTTRRFGGSGLGLAITRRLAELMGGGVGFASTPGSGSRFWLEIGAPEAEPPQVAAGESPAALDGLRVLIVEDNAVNRMIVTKMLEQLGASVETAEDGLEGVAAASRSAFDLVLMDVQMPGIDGLEASRRIRALPHPAGATPIVALTANVMAHQREAYAAAGMDGVVGKPISPAALLGEIARLAAEAPATHTAVA